MNHPVNRFINEIYVKSLKPHSYKIVLNNQIIILQNLDNIIPSIKIIINPKFKIKLEMINNMIVQRDRITIMIKKQMLLMIFKDYCRSSCKVNRWVALLIYNHKDVAHLYN